MRKAILSFIVCFVSANQLIAQLNTVGSNNGIGVTNPTARLEIVNAGNESLRVGVTSNMANTHTQLIHSLAVLGENNTSTSSSGAVAWDYFNNGNASWSGTLLLHHGAGLTGLHTGIQRANQGTLLFQNVANGVVASNGANIHISPTGNVSTTFLTNGNVGIGTTTPSHRLAVVNSTHSAIASFSSQSAGNSWLQISNAAAQMNLGIGSTGVTNGTPYIWSSSDKLAIGNDGDPTLVINGMGSGKVGIGTTNTSDANYRLFVETGIRTRKVKVDQASWADYVFKTNYKLLPLSQLEAFIKQHGHLPEVPTEKEVAANGVDLGDTQTLLLKKIEELTLYMIELKKENAALQKRMAAFENKNYKN
jgi:hypothetical protein